MCIYKHDDRPWIASYCDDIIAHRVFQRPQIIFDDEVSHLFGICRVKVERERERERERGWNENENWILTLIANGLMLGIPLPISFKKRVLVVHFNQLLGACAPGKLVEIFLPFSDVFLTFTCGTQVWKQGWLHPPPPFLYTSNQSHFLYN